MVRGEFGGRQGLLTRDTRVNVSKLPVARVVISRTHRSDIDDSASPRKPSVSTPRSRSSFVLSLEVWNRWPTALTSCALIPRPLSDTVTDIFAPGSIATDTFVAPASMLLHTHSSTSCPMHVIIVAERSRLCRSGGSCRIALPPCAGACRPRRSLTPPDAIVPTPPLAVASPWRAWSWSPQSSGVALAPGPSPARRGRLRPPTSPTSMVADVPEPPCVRDGANRA